MPTVHAVDCTMCRVCRRVTAGRVGKQWEIKIVGLGIYHPFLFLVGKWQLSHVYSSFPSSYAWWVATKRTLSFYRACAVGPRTRSPRVQCGDATGYVYLQSPPIYLRSRHLYRFFSKATHALPGKCTSNAPTLSEYDRLAIVAMHGSH